MGRAPSAVRRTAQALGLRPWLALFFLRSRRLRARLLIVLLLVLAALARAVLALAVLAAGPRRTSAQSDTSRRRAGHLPWGGGVERGPLFPDRANEGRICR